MKKHLLSLAALAATAGTAHAQSSVTLYGLLDAGISYVNHVKTSTGGTAKEFEFQDGQSQSSRWGLTGIEDLGGGTKALFDLEGGFSVGTGTAAQGGALFGRAAYVGVSQTGIGTVTLGRQYSLSTDVLGRLYSNGTNTANGQWAYHFSNYDQLTASYIDNSVKFASDDFAGVTFGALYGFSNTAGAFNGADTPGAQRVYSFGLNYARGPFSIGTAYTDIAYPSENATSSLQPTIPQAPGSKWASTPTLRDLRTFGVGTSYQAGPADIWALWTNTRLTPLAGPSATLNAFDAGLKYSLTPVLAAEGSYTYENVSNAINGHWNQFNLALDYSLSKRTDVYVGTSFQQASGKHFEAQIGDSGTSIFPASGTGSKNQLAARIGVRHEF